jgi:hypothetical protein
MLILKTFIIVLSIIGSLFTQEIIDIMVKGISDAQNDGAQKDRMEATMDAKHQACEKAGIQIKSETTIENFQMVYDLIESKSEAILMPGYQLMDIGYAADGTYQVVLNGKIKIIEEEKISIKELRYAKSLNDREKFSECSAILKKYIDSEDPEVSEELKEESFYYYIKWGYSFNLAEDVEKYSAFYPDSKRNGKLQQFSEFAQKAMYEHKKEYRPDKKQWVDKSYMHEDKIYQQQILVLKDTINIQDFNTRDRKFLVIYQLLRGDDDENEMQTAYRFRILALDKPEPTVVEDRFKTFSPGGSMTFQHSGSGMWYDKFRIKNFQISGNVPVGDEPYLQKITFSIYQKAF